MARGRIFYRRASELGFAKMKHTSLFTRGIVVMACLGTAMPRLALAAGHEKPPGSEAPVAGAPALPAIQDVMLHEGGALVGQVRSADGAALASTHLKLRQAEQVVATTVTDANGNFRFIGVEGGMYTIESRQGMGMYRVWAPNTAPPVARPAATLIEGNQVAVQGPAGGPLTRGQSGNRYGWFHWLTNPWVLTGLIATAIAVPVALNNIDDDDSGS